MRRPPLSFQIKHIGDFLNTLPALGFLKKNFPEQPLGVVVTPKISELASAHPWVDNVLILDRSQGLAQLRNLASDIRRQGYGSALIFDGQTRSIVSAAFAGVKNRIGASGLYPLKGWQRCLYTADVEIRKFPAWAAASQAERGLMMAAAALNLESESPSRPPKPELGPESLAKAEALLAELEGEGPFIGLTLQGLQPEKSWPLTSFSALVKKLRQAFNARIFVTGGPEEIRAADILARSSSVPLGNFCGRTGLLDMVALADRSDLFITVDTGSSHLAALTDTPIISIFIWTNPALWPPQTPHLRILCYDWALARFGLKAGASWRVAPMVGPDMVFEEAASILAR